MRRAERVTVRRIKTTLQQFLTDRIRTQSLLAFVIVLSLATSVSAQDLNYRSSFFRVEMAADQPNFRSLAVDSLGKNKLGVNVMLPLVPEPARYEASRHGQTIEYRQSGESLPAWTFTFSEQSLVIRSNYSGKNPPQDLVLNFDPKGSHATLLGLFSDDGQIRLPALLHFPDHGTFRIATTAKDVTLGYDALRFRDNFVRVLFPAADREQKEIEYRLEVTAVYPHVAGLEGDSRYDGFRRDFLNILPLNPRRRVLANNSASDAVAFTLFEYSMMASHMPPLADDLNALDILRQSLDRYIGGMKGYGMQGYDNSSDTKYDFLDTYPSLVMASSDYVQASHDQAWLQRN
jgi:hypothetical protein